MQKSHGVREPLLGGASASASDAAEDPILARKAHPSARAGRALSTMSSFAAQYRDGTEPDVVERMDEVEEHRETHLSIRAALRSTTKAVAHTAADVVTGQPVGHAQHHRVVSRSRKAAQAAKSKVHAARARLVAKCVFSAAFGIAAFAVYRLDKRDGETSTLGGIPLCTWLILTAAFFPVTMAAVAIVNVGVFLLELGLSTVFENVHYVLLGLRTGLAILISALALRGIVWSLVDSESSRTMAITSALRFSSHFVTCLIIFAVVDLVKNLIARMLALHVHSESMFDTLEDAFEKEAVLGRLMRKLPEVELRARVQLIAHERDIPEERVCLYLKDLYHLSLPADHSCLTSACARMAAMIRQFEFMSEVEMDAHASHAAEYFWWTARSDISGLKLTRDDLMATLNDQDSADYAFSLFDLDGDGYVVEEEVQARFQHIYRERRDVAITLANTEVVLGTLAMLVGAILHTLAFFAYLAIFGVNVSHLVLSLSSMTLAFAFIFGNSLRLVYESVVFLFVVRPYKVGDWIMYGGQFHRVKSFGLLWTHLLRYDGVRVSVPNETLMKSDIDNITESDALMDRIHFEVDARGITPAMVKQLGHMVHEMMMDESVAYLYDHHYHPHASIRAIGNPLKFQIGLNYQLAHNEERYERAEDARSHINYTIGQWQEANGIVHSQSLQRAFLEGASLPEAGVTGAT